MTDISAGKAAEFADPGRKVIAAGGMEVGVFHLGGQFYAWENACPHLDGPVCQGKILPCALEDVKPDKSSGGRVFSKTDDQHRVPLARLRVRHPHGTAPRRQARAAAQDRGQGGRRRGDGEPAEAAGVKLGTAASAQSRSRPSRRQVMVVGLQLSRLPDNGTNVVLLPTVLLKGPAFLDRGFRA